MAIDPKLVSIIPASELPTGDPTNAADFLFYEGDALKKGSMTNIYDKVASGIKGVATQTNAPTAYTAGTYPNGLFERYIVHEPLTAPNNWSNIVVTSADLDVVNGVANNRVILEVSNGVTTKRVERVKGDAGYVPTVQVKGQSTLNVMSQKAVSDEFLKNQIIIGAMQEILGVDYDDITDEYAALYSSLTIKPSYSKSFIQNAFISDLKKEGIWDELSCLLVFSAGFESQNDALKFWNNPSKTALIVGSGVAYDKTKGFTGNGVDSYINTGWDSATDGGGKYTQNNCSAGIYFANYRTASDQSNNGETAYNGQGGLAFAPRGSTTGNAFIRPQGTSVQLTGRVHTNHHFAFTRNSATEINVFSDRTKTNFTNNSVALSTRDVLLLAQQNGSIVQSFSSDTIGLFFTASYLTDNQINAIITAYDKMRNLLDFVELNYTADENVIDTSVWEITNNHPNNVIFYQNNGIIVDELSNAYGALVTDNIIKTKKKRIAASFEFSLTHVSPGTKRRQHTLIGLYCNPNDRIELMVDSVNKTPYFIFRIIKNNTTVYSVSTNIEDFGQFKIEKHLNNDIKLFAFINDAWVQIGATQNYYMPEASLFVASNGNNQGRTTLRDIKITEL